LKETTKRAQEAHKSQACYLSAKRALLDDKKRACVRK